MYFGKHNTGCTILSADMQEPDLEKQLQLCYIGYQTC